MLRCIPQGIDEIIEVFGDAGDPEFERRNIVVFRLPYPLMYGDATVTRARCHRLAVDHFVGALAGIEAAGLREHVVRYGGIYNQRSKRGSAVIPSTHSWGIAIDLEPMKYPLGSRARFPDAVVEVFRRFGFFYGGDFAKRPDPMHFQLCTGF